MVEATTMFESMATMKFTAAETAIMECYAAVVAACEATMEAAAVEAAATHPDAAAVETAAAATKAAAMATTEAATTAAVASSASSAASSAAATTRQRHGWRSQANRRNCQQRDHRLTQHRHSPSEISLPTTTRFAGGDRFGQALRCSTSPLLNSPREMPD
jgi:hypothetical protein